MAFEQGKAPVEYKYYTGLCNFTPVLVNPSKEDLSKYGVNLKEDPSYTDDSAEGNKRVRVDIWGYLEISKEERPFNKVTFFIEDRERESVATPGNFQFINEFGDATWGASAEELKGKYDWFGGNSIRKAKSGEPDLINFIKKLLNIGKNQVAKLDNISALIGGNVKEVAEAISKAGDKRIQVLATIREYDGSFYQSIYNQYFGTAGSKFFKGWQKHLENQIKSPNYQNSLALKEFDPVAISSPSSTESSSDSNPWA